MKLGVFTVLAGLLISLSSMAGDKAMPSTAQDKAGPSLEKSAEPPVQDKAQDQAQDQSQGQIDQIQQKSKHK